MQSDSVEDSALARVAKKAAASGISIGYARVSTEDDDLTLQRDALKLAGCTRIRPQLYARLLSERENKPLRRATDGPWSERGFEFPRLTCYECQRVPLNPHRASA